MSKHAADILGITTPGALAGELVAAALEREDPQAAAIIRAQAQWLRRGDAASREAAEALVHAITDAEHPGRWRSQIYLGDVFSTPSTVLADDHEAHAWVYDDDVVSLPDRYSYDPRIHPTAWDASTTAEDALRAVLDAPRPQPLRSLRLLMFGGTAKPWAVLHERGAHQRVTHLSLRLQRECEESPLRERFPCLRGLACAHAELPRLLGEPLPSLRSLVVYGQVELATLLEALAQAPALRYLGVHYRAWSAHEVLTLLEHPIAQRLGGLDLFDVNHASTFPFATVGDARAAWSHLRFLGLPERLMGPEEHARFDAPQVFFLGHDRRRAIALDFETHGWADSAR